jgi:putative ABC transport system ATP-binding protein
LYIFNLTRLLHSPPSFAVSWKQAIPAGAVASGNLVAENLESARGVIVTIIELKDVKKTYPLGKVKVEAVRGVSFAIEKGDFISIAGPSGSGKSTILNMIGCIDRPTAGTVVIDSKPTQGLSDKQITNLRHEVIGFIFQSFNLIPVLNVYENVEFPLLLGREKMSKAEKKDWIDFLIKEVGLEQWRKHKPNELSGGQRQRVAIARALVAKPQIVLADEPTANLDSTTGEQILELMKKVNRDMQTTFIFSTHDAKIVSIADHVVRLKDGLVSENFRQEQPETVAAGR